jgi:cytochrome c-type biogenesis protein CcmF
VISIAAGLTGLCLLLFRFRLDIDSEATIGFPLGIQVPALHWVAFLVFVAMLALVGNVWRLVEVAKRAKMSVGGFLAHIGVATMLAGMFISRGLERKEQTLVVEGEPGQALGYTVSYKGTSTQDQYDRSRKILFDVSGPERFEARPGAYYTPGGQGDQAQVWPHIERHLTHDVYFSLHSPAIFYWPEPVKIKPGESKTIQDVTVKYDKMEMKGSPGQPGTEFVTHLKVSGLGTEVAASPALKMTENGLEPGFAPLDKHLGIFVVRMDAADKGALMQVVYRSPVYPIEVFYKPMTILVWLGAGILTLGGLLSAVYRRARRAQPVVEEEEPAPDPGSSFGGAPAGAQI